MLETQERDGAVETTGRRKEAPRPFPEHPSSAKSSYSPAVHSGQDGFPGPRATRRCRLQRQKMGIIFQADSLIPFLTALENVALILTLDGVPAREAFRRSRELLERLELAHRADMHPPTLSGGEQQRLAVARAVINDPKVILADEPTEPWTRSVVRR